MSIGRQIRRLREAAGLRAADLAERLGVDPSAVSNLENDRRGVKAEELGTIADFLGVSQLAILEPDSLLGRLPVAHRTNGDETTSRDPLMRLTALAELHQVLTEGGHSAAVAIGEPPRPSSGWLQHATALADWALKFLPPAADGEDRLASLAAAIEDRLGVDVMVESLGKAAPLGLSITDAEFSFILVNADQLRSRALFTLAHELGHVLSGDGSTINIDRDLKARTNEERLANAFAAALLMPEPEIRKAIDDYGRGADCLARMLLRFGVSYETLVYRLHNLQNHQRRRTGSSAKDPLGQPGRAHRRRRDRSRPARCERGETGEAASSVARGAMPPRSAGRNGGGWAARKAARHRH